MEFGTDTLKSSTASPKSWGTVFCQPAEHIGTERPPGNTR